MNQAKERKTSLFIAFAAFRNCCGMFVCTKESRIGCRHPMDIDRFNEIVEIQWPSIQQRLSLSDEDQIVVLDSIKQQVPYQIITEGSEQKTKLIFLASVLANGRSSYTVVKGKPHEFPSLVYGRLVPERKDDFAWENNRVAFVSMDLR